MSITISNELKLRLLNATATLTEQWLGTFPNDYKQLAELVSIKKQKLSLQQLVEQEEESEGGTGGGRGTLKGLRAKDDPNKRNPFSKKMTRR